MISGQLNLQRQDGYLVLRPNRSARWKTIKIFLFLVIFFALCIGISFAVIGLWMILPFTGIEIIVLLLVMYRVARQCSRRQVIHLFARTIRVEQGIAQPQSVWESELFWTRLIIKKPDHVGHASKIILRGRHEQIEIGGFLSELEKKELINKLRPFVSTP